MLRVFALASYSESSFSSHIVIILDNGKKELNFRNFDLKSVLKVNCIIMMEKPYPEVFKGAIKALRNCGFSIEKKDYEGKTIVGTISTFPRIKSTVALRFYSEDDRTLMQTECVSFLSTSKNRRIKRKIMMLMDGFEVQMA